MLVTKTRLRNNRPRNGNKDTGVRTCDVQLCLDEDHWASIHITVCVHIGLA